MKKGKSEQEHYRWMKNGCIHMFDLCKGIRVSFLDLEQNGVNQETVDQMNPNIIEINHCSQGRFECEFVDESFYYLGEGDMSISRYSDQKKRSGFPLEIYRGINIIIDLDDCEEHLYTLLKDFNIDYEKMIHRWKENLPCRILKESEAIRHIFQELYDREDQMTRGYLQLKFIELMLLLEDYKKENVTSHCHFYKSQVNKAKEIREHLQEHLEQEITLTQLAKEYQVSESTIKRCFQAIYGKSPNQYRKEYRMQKAAKMLIDTEEPISEIGMAVGYLNPSKFSSAFHSVLKLTPSCYRNEKKAQ